MWEKGKRKERSPLEGDTRKKLNLDEMETSFDFCQRMTKMMDAYKEKVGTTLALMDMTETPNNNDINPLMHSTFFFEFFVQIHRRHAL